MNEETAFSGWDDVDGREDSESFRSYLDTVTGLESMRAMKRRSHRLLDPNPGDRLLDVGCGNGDDAVALAMDVAVEGNTDEPASDGHVVGIDNSTAMIEEARERAPETAPVNFRVADAQELPFDDETFDGCRSDRVFQHLDDPRTAFSELLRVTRTGGRIVVSDSDWGTLAIDTPNPSMAKLTARIEDISWSCAQNGRIGRKLRRWFLDAGLTEVDVDTATIVLTDLDTANEVFGLDGRIETMKDAGALSDVAATAWLDAAREADRSGTFFSALTLYTVAGTATNSARCSG